METHKDKCAVWKLGLGMVWSRWVSDSSTFWAQKTWFRKEVINKIDEKKREKNPVQLHTAAGWSSPSSLLQAHSSPLEWEPKVSVSLFLCRSRCHQPCQTMFSSQVLWHWGPPESHHQVFLWLSPDVWLIKNSLKGYTAMMVVPFLSWTETFEGGGAHSVSSSKHLLAPWRGANHNRSLTRRKLNLAQRPFGGSYTFPVRTGHVTPSRAAPSPDQLWSNN